MGEGIVIVRVRVPGGTVLEFHQWVASVMVSHVIVVVRVSMSGMRMLGLFPGAFSPLRVHVLPPLLTNPRIGFAQPIAASTVPWR